MATNFINRIAFNLTPETACPVLPAQGSNIADLSGWVVFGAKAAGADADLAGEDVEFSFMEEYGEIRPARSLTRDEIVNFANGVDEISFTAYDGSEDCLSVASSLTTAAHITQATTTTTYRTMLIEVNGLWVDYFPKCDVRVTTATGGYVGDPAVLEFTVRPCGTSTIPGGWTRNYYQ